MSKILVSACLLGQKVRYDGDDSATDDGRLARWHAEGRLVAFCPEVAGGLGTPRPPAEIVGPGGGAGVLDGRARLITADGDDVTDAFLRGARRALAIAREHDIRVAILKSKSPSCGSTQIYDGSFNGTKIDAMGVTAALLTRHGVRVLTEHDTASLADGADGAY